MIESAVIKHLFARYYSRQVRFTYWRGKRDHEVDLVAQLGEELIPFEVKYRSDRPGARQLKGLLELCADPRVPRAYVVTKSLDDFGPLATPTQPPAGIMRIPAALLCYWTGESEAQTS
jgi:hypothetical protein